MSATQSEDFPAAVLAQLHEAEYKAWESLSGYKFLMFGYWAGLWVTLNRIGGWNFKNPWRDLVKVARNEIDKREAEE